MYKTIPVMCSSLPPFNLFIDEIADIWETHWLTNMGDKHSKLEYELSKYLGARNIVLFSNGHLALENALAALYLQGQVITSPFTFASTTHAIVRCNLEPVFCDITDDYYTLDPCKIETLITDRTSAILPVHVYGHICDYEKIQEIADRYSLKVIYDAAHAFGVKLGNSSVASLGDASMFSFHATKVFH